MRLRGVTTAPPCLAPKPPPPPPSYNHHRVAQLAPSVQHHLDALGWVPCPSQLVVFVCEALIDLASIINLPLSLSITGGQDVFPSLEVVLTSPATSPPPHSQAHQMVQLLQSAAKQHQCWLVGDRKVPSLPTSKSVPLGSVLCSAPSRAASAPSALLASSVVCKGAMLHIPCLRGTLDLKTGVVHRTSSSSSATRHVFASLHLTGILCVSKVREAHASATHGKGSWFDDIQPAAYSILLSRLVRIPPPLPPPSIQFFFPAPPPAWPFTAVINHHDPPTSDSLLLHCVRVCFPESFRYLLSHTYDVSYRGVAGRVEVVVCEPPHPGEETSFSISSLPPLRAFFVGGEDIPPAHPLLTALTSIRVNTIRGYERRCRQLNKRVAGSSASNDAALTAALALHRGGKRMREAARAEDGDGVDPLESGAVPCAVVMTSMDDPTGIQGKREITISILRACGLPIPQSLMMPEERNLRPHQNTTPTAPSVHRGFGIDYSKVDKSIPPPPPPSPPTPDITAPSPMCFLASPDMASVFANISYLSSTPLSGGFPTRPFSHPQRPPPSPVRTSHSDGSFSVAVFSTPQANTAAISSSHTTTPLLSPRLTTPVLSTPSGRHTTTAISRTPLADRQASLVSLLSSPPPVEASSTHLPSNVPPQLPRVTKSSFSFKVAGEECPSSQIARHTVDDTYSYALPVGLQVAGLQPSAQLHRELFAPERCRVLGQWDKKFIIAAISTPPGQVLVCLDQHAVHERVRLEYFMASLVEYCQPTPIPPAQGGHLSIPPHLLAHVSKYKHACEYWGWRVDIHSSKITHCPCVVIEGHSYTLSKWYHVDSAIQDLQGCVGGGPEGPFPAPSCIVQIAVLRSCRGAVMFGHEMTMEQCCGIVHALPLVQQYTVCSHGRTSIMPLTEVCNN